MNDFMLTPDSHPLTYAAMQKAMANGYFVAAHRHCSYVALQFTDKKYWRSSAHQAYGNDAAIAESIRLYTEEGWHYKLAYRKEPVIL